MNQNKILHEKQEQYFKAMETFTRLHPCNWCINNVYAIKDGVLTKICKDNCVILSDYVTNRDKMSIALLRSLGLDKMNVKGVCLSDNKGTGN